MSSISDEKRYSEKELVMKQREACANTLVRWHVLTIDRACEEASRLYPLPKTLRVVKDPRLPNVRLWQARDGRRLPLTRLVPDDWYEPNYADFITPAHVSLWHSLLDQPYEEEPE